uniref:Uncharacterized protein n=1 Tax=Arundo donax TaxID=35708 RepID=A0A0A9AQD8_ARUDO
MMSNLYCRPIYLFERVVRNNFSQHGRLDHPGWQGCITHPSPCHPSIIKNPCTE